MTRKLQVLFWAVYIALPIFTGWLAYNWLPNESFDEKRHEALMGREIYDRYQDYGTRVDLWRDKKTGRIYSRDDFKQHRKKEAFRLFSLWFGYGLIGCFFYSGVEYSKTGKFYEHFGKATLINLWVSGCVFAAIW